MGHSLGIYEGSRDLTEVFNCFLCNTSNIYFLLCVYIFYNHKDFFQNIQGGMFSFDLYDKWLGVIDESTEEEKINVAQR